MGLNIDSKHRFRRIAETSLKSLRRRLTRFFDTFMKVGDWAIAQFKIKGYDLRRVIGRRKFRRRKIDTSITKE
jgi:hypothetical protein